VSKNRLGDVLIHQQLVSDEQLRECINIQRQQGGNLASILVQQDYLSEEDLVVTLSEQLEIPHIRVSNYNIPEEVLVQVPESLARQYLILPVSVTGDVLSLAMADPLNIMALDDLSLLTSYEIKPVVAMQSELKETIEKHYGDGKKGEEMYDALISDEDEGLVQTVQKEEEVTDIFQLKNDADDAPVIRLVNLILVNALNAGASDIHIEPFEKVVRVRYRVDGKLEETKKPPRNLLSAIISRIKIMAQLDIAEHRLPQDGRFRIMFKGREIDFRTAILPCYYGEKIVMRVLDKGTLTLDLENLGFEKQPMEAFQNALVRPFGMMLITGPTGSGKTTTLYSALHKLNEVTENVVTVEDPVEYELFGVNQVQTKSEIGFTFASALRQILRQDPDTIMVGEIRDEETADVAVKAALTGHLVLSTLHTNDASSVYTRLTDMNLEPFLVQSSVVLAAAQRLMRKVCFKCAESVQVTPETLRQIQFDNSLIEEEPTFVRGSGCEACKNLGYKGRIAVIEAMPNYAELEDTILTRGSASQIKKIAVKCGMRTLRQNSLAKAARGRSTIEEVLRITTAD
jgi:type IV pilus assembly protein PilB